MAQSSYYATLDKPELGAGRMVVQFGHAKFTKKQNSCTLATTLKSLVGFNYTWKSGGPSEAGTHVGSGMLTTTGPVTNFRVRRATMGGASSGSSFWYEVWGM